MKPSIIICDIDWVLANEQARRKKYLEWHEKDYDGYYSDVTNDWHISILWDFLKGKNVAFFTGRRESCRRQTLQWLDRRPYIKADSELLYMRPDRDFRPARVVKEFFLAHLLTIYDVTLAIDDNRGICRMYNLNGIPTLHCHFYDLETDN